MKNPGWFLYSAASLLLDAWFKSKPKKVVWLNSTLTVTNFDLKTLKPTIRITGYFWTFKHSDNFKAKKKSKVRSDLEQMMFGLDRKKGRKYKGKI